jgi:hypothetical protein
MHGSRGPYNCLLLSPYYADMAWAEALSIDRQRHFQPPAQSTFTELLATCCAQMSKALQGHHTLSHREGLGHWSAHDFKPLL